MAAVLEPPGRFDLELEVWPAGREIVRVYTAARGPLAFNAAAAARFRPVVGAAGEIVPTLYGAEADERRSPNRRSTISAHGRDRSRNSRVERRALARIVPARDLRLAAPHGFGLRKAGVRRTQLIDTPPRSYPQTAKWGQAIYVDDENVDGIVWMSRQFDSQRVVMVWGDRVAAGDLAVVGGSVLPLLAGRGFELASQIALRAGHARINRR